MSDQPEVRHETWGTVVSTPLPNVTVEGDLSLWQPIDQAPRDRPALFFCPYVHSPDGTGSHPEAKPAHGRVVGWWSEEEKHWVAGILQGPLQKIYPSRWAELLAEPETKGAKS